MGGRHASRSDLAKLEYISSRDLRVLPLILPRRLDVQSEVASWFGEEFDNLNILFTSKLSSNSSIMVHNKLAYSIMILVSITFWDKEKIVYRPLSPKLTATSVLDWKRQQPFGRLAASKFIEYSKGVLYSKSQEEK